MLLGFSGATGQWKQAGGAALALACYAAGVFMGSLLSKPIRRAVEAAPQGAVVWPRRACAILLFECLLVAAAAMIATAKRPAEGGLPAHGLVGLCAAAIGLQSAAVSAMRLPGVVTTYITGTWTTMISSLAVGADGEHREGEEPGQRRVLLQAAVLLTYGTAAAGAGFVSRGAGRVLVGWVPAALLALVVGGAYAWSAPEASSP